jgi:hypothetical protein
MLDRTATVPALAVLPSPSVPPRAAACDPLDRILNALEIQIVPTRQRRGPNQTCASAALSRIWARHGADHLTLLLRAIVESEGNEHALIAPVIWAINDVMIACPAWPAAGLAWLEAFDGIDLVGLQRRAKPLGRVTGVTERGAVAGMLMERLHAALTPP